MGIPVIASRCFLTTLQQTKLIHKHGCIVAMSSTHVRSGHPLSCAGKELRWFRNAHLLRGAQPALLGIIESAWETHRLVATPRARWGSLYHGTDLASKQRAGTTRGVLPAIFGEEDQAVNPNHVSVGMRMEYPCEHGRHQGAVHHWISGSHGDCRLDSVGLFLQLWDEPNGMISGSMITSSDFAGMMVA